MRERRHNLILLLALAASLLAAPAAPTRAETIITSSPVVFADPAFRALWRRTDDAASGKRSYLWGPIDKGTTVIAREPYAEAPGDFRLVEYFDKTRMERTNPALSRAVPGFVTNGLLATEMIAGHVQLGDKTFEDRAPAAVTIAGDATDPDGPTYATFTNLTSAPPLAENAPVTQTIDRAGKVGSGGPGGVTASELVGQTNHRTANVFRSFIFSTGAVIVGDQTAMGPLFANGYAGGVGFPITEAYWAKVRVGGVQKDVLVQAFERRVLTYTPGNPPGFEVEAGNVGAQYLRWRYGDQSPPLPAGRIALVAKVGSAPAALVVMDADGSHRATLADPPKDLRHPSWSPDGARIAYATAGKIYAITVSTKEIVKLSDGPDDDLPAWSPDSGRVAFVHGRDLSVVSVANGGLTTLFAGAPGAESVAWSPDGSRLAFNRGPSVWVLGADGFGLRLVLAGAGGAAFRAPSWTPDGTRLVATREVGATRTVVIATADSSGPPRDIAPGSGGAVSPDSRLLLASPTGRITLTNLAGQNARPLTPDGTTDSDPAWSP